tara:strand:+ start:6760 stop:7443 length:684 start_codon:yes stop_codon:yes gene_type:complete
MVKILCLIPARKGSKGIKDKNIKKIKGHSLLEIACKTALRSNLFEDIVLSTDSRKYLNSVKKYLSEKEFLRPKYLSGSNITDFQLIEYSWKKYSKILNKEYDYICLLQPTCPLRKISHLKAAISKIKRYKFDSLWTINSIDKKFNPIKQLLIKGDNLLYYDIKGKSFINRQSLKQTFIRNGCAYVFSKDAILRQKTILPKNCGYIEIKDKLINIDSIKDLRAAREHF